MTDGPIPGGPDSGDESVPGAPGDGGTPWTGAVAGAAGAAGSTGTADAAPERELRKADDDRVLAGVCAGLGQYTGVDPIAWRAAFALTAFAGGVGLLLYTAAWMLMRDSRGGPATFEQMLDRRIPPRAVLMMLTVCLGVATAFSLVGGFGWGTLVLATPLILGLVAARNRGVDLRASFVELREDLRTKEPPPTTPAPGPSAAYYNPAQPWASAPQGPVDLAVVAERTSRSGSGPGPADDDEDEDEDRHGGHGGPRGQDDRSGSSDQDQPRGDDGSGCGKGAPLGSLALWTIVGLAVLVPIAVFRSASSLWSAETADLLFGPETGVYFLATALAVIGLYALVGTWTGDPRGLIFLGLTVALVLSLASVTDLTRVRVGGETWRPLTVAEAEAGDHRFTAGDGTLDLTALSDLEPGGSVDVSVRVNGMTRLVLPENARVELTSRVGLGAVFLDGRARDDMAGRSVTYEEVFEPAARSGGEDGEAEAGDDAEPPLISVHTDSVVGVVEVRHGEA